MKDGQRILRDLRLGDFRITKHAWQRMQERSILEVDISECARTVRSISMENQKYIVHGFDCAAEDLSVVCVWEGETLVITAF